MRLADASTVTPRGKVFSVAMERSVAFLRGINVGGHRVTGGELAAIAAGIGLGNPQTFLASGNLIFDSGEAGRKAITETLCEALRSTLGYEVPLCVLDGGTVRSIAEAHPFEARLLEGRGKLQVVFVGRSLTDTEAAEAVRCAGPDDLLVASGEVVFWSPAAGVLDSSLDVGRLGAVTGFQTTRTHNTVQRIAKKFLS